MSCHKISKIIRTLAQFFYQVTGKICRYFLSMKILEDYIKDVRNCNCDTYEEREQHLYPIFVLSCTFFSIYFFAILGPFHGFESSFFKFSVIISLFPLSGFILALFLTRKYTVNEILSLPSLGCLAAATLNLMIPEFHAKMPYLYTYIITIGIIYASFIASVRCNLIIYLMSSSLPFIIAANMNHLNIDIVLHQMAVVLFAGMLGSVFSYRLNVYQKGMKDFKINLSAEKQTLELAQKVAKIGNWSFDVKSGQINWSKQMFEIFPEKYEDGAPSYEKHRSTIHEDDVEYWESTVGKCLEDGLPYKMQYRTFKEDGETVVWTEARGQAIKNEAGEVVQLFGTCQDITEFKNLERELRREKSKMVQTAKLATLGEMAAGVAHEINNPAGIIKGHATMLRRKKDKADEAFIEKMVVGIEKSVDRISKIVNGLRKFSRVTEGNQYTQIKVHELYSEVINLTHSKASSAFVKVECEEIPSDLSLLGDEITIEQVLINLIGNAIDAQEGRKDAWVKVKYNDTDKFHELIVMDSGHGIPEALIQNLFDPFFTTKEVGKGTGLGLSISKGIAQEHNGDLTYKIIDGHTAFILSIPKEKAQSKKKSEAA